MLNKIIPPKIATAEAKLIWQPVIYQLLKEENENLWNKTHTFSELHLEFSMYSVMSSSNSESFFFSDLDAFYFFFFSDYCS